MSRVAATRSPEFVPVGITSPSAGVAGLDSVYAQTWWADESRHGLTSPGAYEWWYFHSATPSGDGIQLMLFEGLPFHPQYLTQINRFTHRLGASLSKKPWPDLRASRYPAAYLAVTQGGKRVAQFLNLYPPDSSTGGQEIPDIRIGPNRITLRQDGSFGIVLKGYPFTVTRGRPRREARQVLSADLTFTPTFMGIQHTRPFRAPDRSGATHHWVLAAPHGKMTGTVQCRDSAADEMLLDMSVDGLAYHDHVYGQGGLGTGISTLTWGFIQGDTWTAAWQQTLSGFGLRSKQRGGGGGIMFFEVGHDPLVIDAPDAAFSKVQRSSWLLRHAGRIAMHGSDAHGHALELVLNHTRTVDTAPFHTRLAAEGTVTIPGRGPRNVFAGRGTTHVLKLARLQWPVLSDLTLLAITPIARDDPLWTE